MASRADVWAILRRVRSLRFDSQSDAGTGWDGTGTGTVAVTEPAPGVVVFDEGGTWRPAAAGRADTRFTNVFRWSEAGDGLRLEHLRHGPDRPVLLFDLAPGADGRWREDGPHLCGEDCYTAVLTVEPGRVLVEWSIRGPRKRETIRYTYW